MSKIIFFIITSIIFATVVFNPKITYAQNISIKCDVRFQNYVRSAGLPDKVALGQPFEVTVNFNTIADPSFKYQIKATQLGTGLGGINFGNFDVRSTGQLQITNPADPSLKFTMADNNKSALGIFRVNLMHSEGLGEENVCELGTINFYYKELSESSCNLKMPDNVEIDKPFSYTIEKKDNPELSQKVYFYRRANLDINKLPKGLVVVQVNKGDPPISIFAPDGRVYENLLPANPAGSPETSITFDNKNPRLNGGEYIAIAEIRKFNGIGPNLGFGVGTPLGIGTNGGGATFGFGPPIGPRITVVDNWFVSYCSYHSFKVSTDPTSAATDGTQITAPGTGGTIGGGGFFSELCIERIKKDPSIKCAEGGGKIIVGCSNDSSNPGVATAIGCIHTNPAEFAKDLLRFIIGISGGLAFLMMLLGAFQMLTSAGNPETLNAGKERLTSAVIGLLFVIFAVLLLQIIGAGILNIPGF